MNIKEVNGRLTSQAYVAGFAPSNEDAKLFAEMFGNNSTVVQWAAQMASYYNSERAAIVNPPKAKAPAPKKAAAPAAAKKADDDDDMDLFGEETEEEAAAKQKKKDDDKAAAEKKKKAAPIAKSSILMDIKVWEADQDIEALAAKLKKIEKDGLLWGAHKLTPIAYGVKKLTIIMVIEDDKVSSEDIEDMILVDHEDEIQSMDIVAWNKI